MAPTLFSQPFATRVETHLIECPTAWDEFLGPQVSSTLAQLDGLELCQILTRASQVLSEEALASCQYAVSRITERLREQSVAERCLPRPGRRPQSVMIGRFVADVLQAVIPEWQVHYEPEYARAMYPCQAHVSAVRWALPRYGRADAVLTCPIALFEEPRSGSPPHESPVLERAASPLDGADSAFSFEIVDVDRVSPGQSAPPSPTTPSESEEQTSLYESASSGQQTPPDSTSPSEYSDSNQCAAPALASLDGPGPGSLDDSTSSGDSSCPSAPDPPDSVDGRRHPFWDAHLLRRARPRREPAALALLCVAAVGEVHSLVCSALMQRRVFGVGGPLLGLASLPPPHGPSLCLVGGWMEACPTHACVQMHVAHASPSRPGAQHGLGVFDLSQPRSAWSLVLFLVSLRDGIYGCAQDARSNVARARSYLLSDDSKPWRVDLVQNTVDVVEYEQHLVQRIEHWRSGCTLQVRSSVADTVKRRRSSRSSAVWIQELNLWTVSHRPCSA